MGFDGGEATTIAAGPVGGSGNAFKILRSGGQVWAGAKVSGLSIPLSANKTTITARVHSPTAGIPFVLKLEGPNASAEVQASTPVVQGWQTLSWTFSGGDLKTWTDLVFLPNLGTLGSGEAYFVDDVTGVSLPAPVNSAAEMGSGGPQTLTLSTGDNKGIFTAGEAIFAFDYKGGLDQLNNYASYTGGRSDGTPGNGNIGFFQDAALSNSAQKIDEGGWIVGTSLDPGGTPNFFRYFVLKAPAFTTSYMGLYANAPNNGTVNVSAFANIKFRLWGPAEMYQLNNLNPVVEITLTGPKVSGCGTGSGGTEISKNLTANQKIGAGSVYKMALATGWTVKGLCGTDTNLNARANVLATLARVIVTVPGTSFNFTNSNANSNPVSFSTGVNLGPIGFTNN